MSGNDSVSLSQFAPGSNVVSSSGGGGGVVVEVICVYGHPPTTIWHIKHALWLPSKHLRLLHSAVEAITFAEF